MMYLNDFEYDIIDHLLFGPSFDTKTLNYFIKKVYGVTCRLRSKASYSDELAREQLLEKLPGSRPAYGLTSCDDLEAFLSCLVNWFLTKNHINDLCRMFEIKTLNPAKSKSK